MNALTAALAGLAAGTSLSPDQSEAALGCILDGGATDAATAAFLTAVRIRGETADELEGAVRAIRGRMTPWEPGIARDALIDTCGTGGDGAATINLSTAVAIVVAACGVPVVKHGNRSASSRSGSSDVVSALGVATDAEPSVLRRCLSELKIAFLFAPKFHPGLLRVAAIRRALPFPTLFNLAGPLCNPASPRYQLVGAPDESHAELLTQVLLRQPHIRRAAVVTGSDGLDEVTLGGQTSVRLIERGAVERITWQPGNFGLGVQSAAALEVGDSQASAARLNRVFAGERGPARDYVLANSAAALWVTGNYSLRAGVSVAATAIESGAAAALLDRWRRLAPAQATPAEG
jgi:anthranilate phosphoribosyltransferase